MFNILLLWIKENYEKLILYCLGGLLLITGINLFLGGDRREEELREFAQRIEFPHPQRLAVVEERERNLENYFIERPFSYYHFIYARNPFFPLRLLKVEPEKKEVTIEKEAKIEMNFECTKIIFSPENILVATLKNIKTGETYEVKKGEEAEGWKVVAIEEDSVTLRSKDGQTTILKPPPVEMNFELVGIMRMGGVANVVLRNVKTDRDHLVTEGKVIDGWKILEIKRNSVIIQYIYKKDGPKHELRMEK